MEISYRAVFEMILSKRKDLENPDVSYQTFIKKLAKYQFQMKAINQDILGCRESMEELNKLNELGRAKIAMIREEIDNLEMYAKEIGDQKYILEVDSQRHQLASTVKEFKRASVTSLCSITKAQREELFNSHRNNNNSLRKRKNVDREGLVKISSGVTEQLLSISRQLADTTQKSQSTLDSLVLSSSTVHGTKQELSNTAGSIAQSSKLLKKYGRREFTDKLIMFFAFLFFLAVCLYIVQKRMF